MTTKELITLLKDGGVGDSQIRLDTGDEILGVKVITADSGEPITQVLTSGQENS